MPAQFVGRGRAPPTPHLSVCRSAWLYGQRSRSTDPSPVSLPVRLVVRPAVAVHRPLTCPSAGPLGCTASGRAPPTPHLSVCRSAWLYGQRSWSTDPSPVRLPVRLVVRPAVALHRPLTCPSAGPPGCTASGRAPPTPHLSVCRSAWLYGQRSRSTDPSPVRLPVRLAVRPAVALHRPLTCPSAGPPGCTASGRGPPTPHLSVCRSAWLYGQRSRSTDPSPVRLPVRLVVRPAVAVHRPLTCPSASPPGCTASSRAPPTPHLSVCRSAWLYGQRSRSTDPSPVRLPVRLVVRPAVAVHRPLTCPSASPPGCTASGRAPPTPHLSVCRSAWLYGQRSRSTDPSPVRLPVRLVVRPAVALHRPLTCPSAGPPGCTASGRAPPTPHLSVCRSAWLYGQRSRSTDRQS